MSGSVKFLAAATVAIIIVALGVYMAGRSWIDLNQDWDMSNAPAGSTPRAPMEDAHTLKTQSGDTITISPNVDQAKLGVPIYPGAEKEGGGTMVLSDPALGSEEIAGARYTTPDSFAKVLQFYKNQVGPKALVHTADNEDESSALLSMVSPDGRENLGISITRKRDSTKTEISIQKGMGYAKRAATKSQ